MAAVPAIDGQLRRVLPRGYSLPPETWERRHRGLLWVLVAACVLVGAYSGATGGATWHTWLHGLAGLPFAVLGALPWLGRRVRSALVSLGLSVCAAVLVHAADGLTEAHFAFFVLICVLALYEDWLPFGVAVGFVAVHHLGSGLLDAAGVYQHDGNPWSWAAIHTGALTAAGLGALTTWRLNEDLREERDRSLADARRHQEDVLAIVRLTAEISGQADARQRIAEAVLERTDCLFAAIVETDKDGGLVATGLAGLADRGVRPPVDPERSLAAQAYLDRRRSFVGDVEASGSRALLETGARSVVYEPLMRGERCVGVLMAAWDRPIEVEADRDVALIRLLANEAAAVLERSDLVAQLRELARNDHLTGLPNRRTWEEQLQQAAARAARSGNPLCVALIDLDHFKRINDNEGHQMGDRLLRAAAAGWTSVLRETDCLGRIGGDEFGLLLPDCDETSALEVLERMRGATRGVRWSAGVIRALPGEDPGRLVGRADRALYSAKAAGRERVFDAT